jgi:hypothetical protein
MPASGFQQQEKGDEQVAIPHHGEQNTNSSAAPCWAHIRSSSANRRSLALWRSAFVGSGVLSAGSAAIMRMAWARAISTAAGGSKIFGKGKGGWATYGTRTRDIHDHNVALYQLS